MRLFRIVWRLAGRLFRAARMLLECAQLDVAGGFAQPRGELRRGLGGDETPVGGFGELHEGEEYGGYLDGDVIAGYVFAQGFVVGGFQGGNDDR